jgi:hypothetical protein
MSKVVCDSSALISLSGTCNLGLLEFFTKRGHSFVIPPAVQDEIVTRPVSVPRFAFSALRLGRLVKHGMLSVVTNAELDLRTKAVMDASNRLFMVDGRYLEILHLGEAQCMALLSLEPGAYSGFLVDEKTARLVLESPEKLADALRSEFEGQVKVNQEARAKIAELFPTHSGIFRSAEMAILGGESGYYKNFEGLAAAAMHASVHAMRNAGCSIAETEMAEYDALKL